MRFFRRFLFFIYSGEICVFVRPFRFLLMNASFKNGRTFRFADYILQWHTILAPFQ